MQRLHCANREKTALAAQKINAPEPQTSQHRVEYPVMTQQLLEPQRADKRRQYHRSQYRRIAQPFARKIEAVIHQRQRQRNGKTQQGGHQRHRQRVYQTVHIYRVAEHFANQPPVKPPGGHRIDRPQQEHGEKRRQPQRNNIAHHTIRSHFPSPAKRAASK
ncbi:hypothetical protein SDC9_176800 [bioreactor metagenome]|uniref:Uncharacterized protein n=1 Tax=bioreactor metagenome TaxID=1076179 RepID=A0A645GR25_9ZZZZ